MRYSPSTGGFYPESIDYPNLPEDLITITDEEHQAAMNKPAGATLSLVDGKLEIILPPEKSDEEKLAIAKQNALQGVSVKHSQILSELTGNATPEERDTWSEKAAISKQSVVAGQPTDEAISVFQREATALGKTVMQRCQRSLQLRAAYLTLVGLASGFKTELEISINSATSAEEVDSILLAASQAAEVEINQFKALVNS
jgi:hypothetical protein